VPDTVTTGKDHLTLSIVGTGVYLALPSNCPSVEELHSWIPHACRGIQSPLLPTDVESDEDAVAIDADRLAPEKKLEQIPGFDRDFYLAMNPDVRGAGIDPEVHFRENGWKEGRDPNPFFSTRFYLETSPDVREAGINPFEHFLNAGHAEGRLGKQPGGYRAQVVAGLKSLEKTAADWVRKDEVILLSEADIAARLSKAASGRTNGIVVAFSHDDYTKNIGGIQLCLALEQNAFALKDCCYVQINPWQPLPVLSTRDQSDVLLSFSIDGKPVGNCWSRDLLSGLKIASGNTTGGANSLIVHALHGHSVDFIIALYKAIAPREAFFWLHDYFSVCTGFNLLRNCVSFCGAPKQSSQACAICVFGDSRPAHINAIERLFAAIDFTVVGPSLFVTDYWKNTVALPHSSLVAHEHCSVVEDGCRVDFPELKIGPNKLKLPKKLRIAFLGQPVAHKGWPVFRDLVLQQCANPNYEFIHLGTHPDGSLPVHFREVRVTPGNTNAMVDALRLERIDAVVQWSIWPETFCITAHEALAAGAIVITSTASGNIPCLVEKVGAGLIFDSEQALWSAFASDEVALYVAQRKQKGIPCGSLKFSGMTADLVRHYQKPPNAKGRSTNNRVASSNKQPVVRAK
jgi:glycosyltransferase involved in cell wall biosynthesis